VRVRPHHILRNKPTISFAQIIGYSWPLCNKTVVRESKKQKEVDVGGHYCWRLWGRNAANRGQVASMTMRQLATRRRPIGMSRNVMDAS
jgi:hypothetical protein